MPDKKIKNESRKKSRKKESHEILQLRKKIDLIDSRIIELLSERAALGKMLGKLKKSKGLKITNKAREDKVIRKAVNAGEKHGLEPEFIRKLFIRIVDYTRKEQQESSSKKSKNSKNSKNSKKAADPA